MGGYGSGRRSNRWTTDDCLRINLSHLKQRGMLRRHCMTRREQMWGQYGQTIASLTLVLAYIAMLGAPAPAVRSAVMSSRIQKPRPYVATTRSPNRGCTTMP